MQGDVRAETWNGRIAARDLDGKVDLETRNGSIRLSAVGLSSPPSVRAVTRNGSVSLELPSAVSARLSLATRNGRVRKVLEAGHVEDLEASRSRVRAVLNGGAGEIAAETSNGDVDLRLRP
ncbi:MAG: DUF4097 family beta strand repeat protein [Planctomycetes bacterium]|nr:DUF4097 family beta strand repeat protein [Planctomycetota bacterium]